MKRRKAYFCRMIDSVILAGLILFFMGLYYWMIKAGIPYQDPPLELQIQYAIYMGTGELLLEKGLAIAGCGGLVRLGLRVAEKRLHTKAR